MTLPKEQVIRAAPETTMIFSIVFLPFLLVGLSAIFKTGQLGTGLFFCTLYPAAIYAISSPTVFITNDTLKYRTLLGARSIRLSSITQVSVTAQPAPTLQLVTSEMRKPFRFIIKPFTKAGVTFILRSIRISAPTAKFDAISDDLSNGDFSSVTREAIKSRNLIRIAFTVGGALFVAAIVRTLTH